MKHWLIRLYPSAWRRRYGDEFSALLAQQSLTPHDVIDILRGAADAHWRSLMIVEKEQREWTFTIRIQRRTVYGLLLFLLLYIGGYGVVRSAGLLIHMAGNRYTAVSNHYVQAPRSAFDPGALSPALEVVYLPLRTVESVSWPLIDSVYHPSSQL